MNGRHATSSWVLATGLALVLSPGGDANAVTLNPRGTGQVLLYPFYTVNGGNDTLVSINNATSSAKALRVRIAEGENGRDAYSFNLYLAPFDTWSAVLFKATLTVPGNATVSAGLRTGDHSCTVPAIESATELVGGGVALRTSSFSGPSADAGGTDLARLDEGSIEVMEMGTIIENSPSAASTAAMGPDATGCAVLAAAWEPGGYWAQDSTTDLSNPTGGVYGTAYVVDVSKGTVFSHSATAIDGFRSDPDPTGATDSVVLHTKPGSAQPNLGDALNDPASATAVAQVLAGGKLISATYAAPANAVDAVTAVLMASAIDSDYLADPSLGATTTYVFSYPTRRFYTDPAIAGSAAIAPFTSLFGGIRTQTVSETIPYANIDADGHSPIIDCGVDACVNRLQSPGTSVEVLAIGNGASTFLDSALTMAIDGASPADYSASGRMRFLPDLSSVPTNWTGTGLPPYRYMRPSTEGKSFAGLPVLGFSALNFVNANAQPGILANYSAAIPLRAEPSCYFVYSGGIAGSCD